MSYVDPNDSNANLTPEQQMQAEMQSLRELLTSMQRERYFSGQPRRPEFVSPVYQDEEGNYRMPENLTVQSDVLEQMKAEALAPGLTTSGRANVEAAGRQALQSQLTARQQLAMRGGLSAGAQERLAGRSARDTLMARQQARLGDQFAKQQLQAGVSGLESAQQQYNINNILDAQRDVEKAKLAAYKAETEAWAAKEAGSAQRASSDSGGCFITTACCEVLGLPDDNAILNTFRAFRDKDLGGKEGVEEYYNVAPKIIEEMEKREDINYLYTILSKYLIPCHKLLKEENKEEAYQLYKKMVEHLTDKYIVDKED